MSDTQSASEAQHQRAPNDPLRHEQVVKTMVQEIQTMVPRRNPHEVFRAFTEISALTIHQSLYHAGMVERDDDFNRIERAYLKAVQPYSRQELDGFARLYSRLTLAFATYPATDLLGRVYMELDIHNKHAGQYFSPPGVARAMAKIMLHDVRSHIEQKGFVTIGEPACGSGCMLIEVANELHDLGYHPMWVMRVHATDISRDCFNMAYFQLALLNIPAVVVHGNTLTLEIWEHRPTPMWTLIAKTHGLTTDGTRHQPVAVPIASSVETSPDIDMPGGQLQFHFEPHPKGD